MPRHIHVHLHDKRPVRDALSTDPKQKFTIEGEMPEEHVNKLLKVLKYMELLGGYGSSRKIELFCDGDGAFRPKFKFDREVNIDDLKQELEDGDGNLSMGFD